MVGVVVAGGFWCRHHTSDTVRARQGGYALTSERARTSKALRVPRTCDAPERRRPDPAFSRGATEPGPWLAAVFVAPEVRSRGTGSALVHHIVERCRQRGDATLYLYTDEQQSWYESMGWTFIRQATLNDITHVVMYIATD